MQENIILEDGDSYPQVLEVHPPWVPGGELWGEYDLRHLPLQRGDFFFAKVGFPQSAVRGEATFKIHYRTDQADAPVTTVASLADQYDGEDQEKQIKSWQVPLADDLTGGYFYLEVDAGSKTLQDEATWVEAQILRPLR